MPALPKVTNHPMEGVYTPQHAGYEGCLALVTGASRGIGKATAMKLAEMGFHVALAARSESDLNALKATLSEQYPQQQFETCPLDVLNTGQCAATIRQLEAQYQQVDLLINNAGIANKIGLLQELTPEQIDQVIDVNLKAPIHLMKQVLPGMVARQSGTIININSIAGKTAFPYWGVYDASKFGLRAITEAVAEEQRSNGIRVVGVYPGAVETDIWDSMDMAGNTGPDKAGMLRPEDVANAVAYILAQPRHVFISEVSLSPLIPAL